MHWPIQGLWIPVSSTRLFSQRAQMRAPLTHQPKGTTTMKRIILLASILGFAASLAASAAEPKETWTASCARCHGADGKGQTAMGRKLGAKALAFWMMLTN